MNPFIKISPDTAKRLTDARADHYGFGRYYRYRTTMLPTVCLCGAPSKSPTRKNPRECEQCQHEIWDLISESISARPERMAAIFNRLEKLNGGPVSIRVRGDLGENYTITPPTP